MFTFSEWVEGMYHELEDAVPHEAVVEGGRASTSLEPWLGLSRETRQDAVSSQKLRASALQIGSSPCLVVTCFCHMITHY